MVKKSTYLPINYSLRDEYNIDIKMKKYQLHLCEKHRKCLSTILLFGEILSTIK
jgi:hypothetical protein